MAFKEAVIAALAGVPVIDFLLVNGLASKLPGFKYRYWPFTRWRWVSVAILSVGAFTTGLIIDIPENRLWPLLPIFTAMTVHGGIALADIFRQRQQS
ncbi:hypothetical protein [Novosphingobium sp. SG707]|uniref:hypothetical protein n=1 Tax=Novosphingobium sp. SG707 TaxID=2586996 RepID=UPI0014481868|nr:hypothetical protein [Novosphingobium sp. SG707]